MFERISFYIGNTMIEINGYRFPLGELTTEILNLPKDIYAELRHTLEAAEEHLTTYLRSRDVAEWFAANEKMILLDQRMMRYRIFRLVKQESSILAETRLFTQQYSLFPEKDCDLTEDDSVSAWLEETPQFFPDGAIDFTIVKDGLRIDALCSNWGPRAAFWNIKEPQLAWFTEEQKTRLLDGRQDLPRIIVSHAPPCGLPSEQTGLDHELHAPHEPFQRFVRETCDALKPLAWLGGHNHMTIRRRLNETQLVTAPAFSEAPFEAKLFEFKDGGMSMKTIVFGGSVGFQWRYDFDKTHVQGRACDRNF